MLPVFSDLRLALPLRDQGAYAPWANLTGRGTSAMNITKGAEIAVMKEL